MQTQLEKRPETFDKNEEDNVLQSYVDDPEKLKKALSHVYRNQGFYNLIERLESIAKEIETKDSSFNNKYRTWITVHTTLIQNRITVLLRTISETLDSIQSRMKDNPYNIKDVLDHIARHISSEPINPEILLLQLKIAETNMCNSSANYIYSSNDINIAKEEGFEEGYEACLKAIKNGGTQRARASKLDLP